MSIIMDLFWIVGYVVTYSYYYIRAWVKRDPISGFWFGFDSLLSGWRK